MRFANPILLWTLVAIPAGIARYALRERRRPPEEFARPGMMPNVLPDGPRWRRHLVPGLYLLALAILLLALARPEVVASRERERGTVVLAIDTSLSMEAPDVSPTRLEAARRAAEVFLEEAPEEFDIGAVTFNREARVASLPVRDRAAVSASLRNLETTRMTAIGDGISLAVETIPVDASGQAQPPGAIVLLTDGNNTRGIDPEEALAGAAAAGIDVHLVALGTDEPPAGFSPTNFDYLRRLSERSGGYFATAASSDELARIYRNLGSSVLSVERWEEVTPAVAGAGAVLLVLGATLGLMWFNRIV